MAKNKWKKREGIVYSTNPQFEYQQAENQEEQETLSPNEQELIISLDRKARKGKSVTLIDGFVGNFADLKELSKYLKLKCGVGGSVKDGQILIQGDQREKISTLLAHKNYRTKISAK